MRKATTNHATDQAPTSDVPSLDDSLAEMANETRRALDSARKVLYVESQRAHVLAVEAYFQVAFYVCLLGFGLTASISAALFIVRGIGSAIGSWSGSEWLGELGAGVAVLAVVVGGGLAVRTHLTRDILRRVKQRMSPLRDRTADETTARTTRGAAA